MPHLVPSQLRENEAAWAVFERWDKPFLIAFTDSDVITRGQEQAFLARVPTAQNVVIRGAGHFVQEDAGRALAGLMVDFMQGKALPAEIESDGPDAEAPVAVFTSSSSVDSALLRLHVFDCGELSFPDISAFGLKNADTDVRRMFVPCYLIRHPRGDLLWDAGLDRAIVGARRVIDGGGFTMTYARSLLDQLDDMGLSPDDVDFMALSHMHFDHVGAATQFSHF